jgi:hypothetical protein
MINLFIELITTGNFPAPKNPKMYAPWWAVEAARWLAIVFLGWVVYVAYKQYKKKQHKKK